MLYDKVVIGAIALLKFALFLRFVLNLFSSSDLKLANNYEILILNMKTLIMLGSGLCFMDPVLYTLPQIHYSIP